MVVTRFAHTSLTTLVAVLILGIAGTAAGVDAQTSLRSVELREGHREAAMARRAETGTSSTWTTRRTTTSSS
jgi:hypothetical protein